MKLLLRHIGTITTAICLLYIMLFVYAAVSKLIDFDVFYRQLAMSPVLTSHAYWIVYAVPATEIILALLITFPKTRMLGLFGSLCLMASFTIYIYLIMNYASHVPCSCGGILEDMGWNAHFYFNLTFIGLALVVLFLNFLPTSIHYRNKVVGYLTLLLLGLAMSCGLTVKLFLISERIVHYENRFQRSYPHPSGAVFAKVALPHNSYYVAGFGNGRVYLGNVTAPLHVLSCNYSLQDFKVAEISIDTVGLSFNSAQLRVQGEKFYLFNGTVPYVFEGRVIDWKGDPSNADLKRFTLAEVVDGDLVVRTFSEKGDNLLGMQQLSEMSKPSYEPNMLVKQADGIFDTDGMLVASNRKFVYLYYYRNEFIVGDMSLKIHMRGKTIDTISRAQVKIAESSQGLIQLGQSPLLVNRRVALYNNLLFVNSQLPGKEDIVKLWKQASIIDVYDIHDGSYRFSFPLHDIDGRKFDSFRVVENHLFIINEKWIVRYDLRNEVMEDH